MPDATQEFERRRALEEQAAAEGGFHGAALQREISEVSEADSAGLTAPVGLEEVPPEAAEIATMSQGQLAWRRFRRHKLAMARAMSASTPGSLSRRTPRSTSARSTTTRSSSTIRRATTSTSSWATTGA